MKLKTFKASSMREALAQVKREMGSRAVILGAREYRTGGFLGLGKRNVVEVTVSPEGERARRRRTPGGQGGPDRAGRTARSAGAAATRTYGQLVEQAKQQAMSVSADELRSEIGGLKKTVEKLIRETRSQRNADVPDELVETYLSLVSNEVADELAKDLVKRICSELPESEWKSELRVREALVRTVASRIDVAGPSTLEGPTPRVIALVGPTGVGKTTTIAKLAAQFKLQQGHSVGLVTIDTYRIAAVDQLRTYADILDIPLKVVLSPRELKQAIDGFRDKDFVLIDSAGRSQRDVLKMNQLRQYLDAAQPDETHLVVSTTSGQQTALGIIDKFREFDVDRIILTKLDEAVGFGIVLAVMQQAQRKLSYVTAGQDVPEDIEPGDPRKLAELIVPAVTPHVERTDA